MLAFELTEATATLENFNARTEKHGPDRVPAASLRISAAQDADVLAFFSPTLKTMLFNANGQRDLADGMPLRDPHMVYPIARDEEMTGATVHIGYGVGEPIVLTDCILRDFKLTPMEGGSVIVLFTVNCKPDPHKDVPRLYLSQSQGVSVSVEPMELATIRDAG